MPSHHTPPCRFGAPASGAPPPRALLDWIGDVELHTLLFEMEITRLGAEVDPPPNTRHIAVRTGKRYSKTSLTSRNGQDLARTAACVPVTPRANSIQMARSRQVGVSA